MRVLIVDDEPLFRIGIKSVLRECGVEKIAEAQNGVEAIELLRRRRFDLILSDVKMPEIDGIGLAKWFHESSYPGKLYMLSGYDDYDYVRDTLQHGAEDYLLKYEIDKNVIEKTLAGIQDKSDSGTSSLDILEPLVLGELDGSAKKCAMKRLEMMVSNQGEVIFCCIQPKITPNRLIQPELLIDLIEEFFAENAVSFPVLKKECCCIVVKADKDIQDILQQIIFSSKKYQKINISIGVSSVGKLSDVEVLWRQAFFNSQMFFYDGWGRVFSGQKDISNNAVAEINQIKTKIIELCSAKNYQMLPQTLNTLKSIVKEQQLSPDFVKNTYQNVCEYIGITTGKSVDLAVFKTDINFTEANDFLDNIAFRLYGIAPKVPEGISKSVQKCVMYIHMNYWREDLSLKSVAEDLGYTMSYISRLFKKEMGINVIDYINHTRIEYAKLMLKNSKNRIGIVAKASGYSNAGYFTKVFKRVVQLSPAEYIMRCSEESV